MRKQGASTSCASCSGTGRRSPSARRASTTTTAPTARPSSDACSTPSSSWPVSCSFPSSSTRARRTPTPSRSCASTDGTVVMHCFSEPGLLEAGLERGWYFSFAGNVTYPKAAELRDVAAGVPADRILAETDSPYLAPQPVRGRQERARLRRPHRRRPRRGARRRPGRARRPDRRERDRRLRAAVSVRPKKQLGQHFLVDENILGVIGRLAELDQDDVVLEIGPGLGVLTRYLADRVGARTRGRARPVAEPQLAGLAARPNVELHWGDALELDLARIGADRDEARRQSALQRGDADRGREPRRPARRRALVCDGAARGRRPLLRRALDEGVRRRVGARPARGAAHRASIPVARTVFRPPPNVDSALVAFERTALPAGFARIKAVVEASFAHRRKTLPNSLALAGLASREQAATALEAIGRPPQIRAEALEPAEFVALAGGVVRAPAPAKINLALVVGPARGDGKHEVATVLQRVDLGDRVSARSRARRSRSRVSRRHDRPRRADGARGGRGRRAALAGDDREADPRRRRARRRQLRRRDGAPARERDARDPARAGRAARARGHDRRGRPLLPRRRAAARSRRRRELEPLDLPQDYWVVLALPHGAVKESTAAVYRALRRATRRGRLGGAAGSARPSPRRRQHGRATSRACRRNDLASSPLAAELRVLGAFRADVSGAGPAGLRPLPPPTWTPRRRGGRCAAPRAHLADGAHLVRVTDNLVSVDRPATIEHRSTRLGRALRANRLKLRC